MPNRRCDRIVIGGVALGMADAGFRRLPSGDPSATTPFWRWYKALPNGRCVRIDSRASGDTRGGIMLPRASIGDILPEDAGEDGLATPSRKGSDPVR
jgi:hypothetical protein